MRSMQPAMSLWRHFCGALMLSVTAATQAAGQGAIVTPDSRPYDERLMRLSEILGAVHYLRELCGANDVGEHLRQQARAMFAPKRLQPARAVPMIQSRSFSADFIPP